MVRKDVGDAVEIGPGEVRSHFTHVLYFQELGLLVADWIVHDLGDAHIAALAGRRNAASFSAPTRRLPAYAALTVVAVVSVIGST